MPKRILMRATLAALLLAVAFVPTAGAYRLEGGRWPTTTIRYYNEVPAYRWAVDSAAYAWNSSGARVQFLKSSRRDADVLVGIRWFKIAGEARIPYALAGYATDYANGVSDEPTPVEELVRLIGESTGTFARLLGGALPRVDAGALEPVGTHLGFD